MKKRIFSVLMAIIMTAGVVSVPAQSELASNNRIVMEAQAASKTAKPTTSQVPKSVTLRRGDKIQLRAPSNATLYYTRTTDGSKPSRPTVNSKRTVAPGKRVSLTISQTTRIRVIAVRKGREASSVASRTYTVPVTKKPTSTNVPKSRTVSQGTKIRLTAPSNAALYYTRTTNGSTPARPTTSSRKISAGKSVSITVNKTTRIRVMARRSGRSNSSTVSRTYTVNGSSSTNSAFAAEVLKLTNKERTSRGLTALKGTDSKLNKAANIRAEEIRIDYRPDHSRPDGRAWSTVFPEVGVSFKSAGENMAMGQKTPKDVVKSWMDSKGHRDNILNSGFTHLGVGVVADSDGKLHWIQLFRS
jgi:uncharacterized protein YkwD